MFLSVENLYKRFDRTEVLKGVSFSMEKGRAISVIGTSGSGKTTLLRCLNFLEMPNAGKITLGGEVLYDGSAPQKFSEMQLRQKRLHFGMVFQQFNLFPQYTALRNVTLAPGLLLKKKVVTKGLAVSPAEIEQNARALLDRVGLSDKTDSYPCQLSGGQQQRVAIARALALQPDILCFDEPTSALDPALTGEVRRVITELKSTDTTMIIVTHDIEFAAKVSDYIFFMADGVIEEEGTPEQVIMNPQRRKTREFLQQGDA